MRNRLSVKIAFPAIAGLLLSSIFVATVTAQQATPSIPSDDQVNAIAKDLYCPVCENIPLDVCPTQACAEWRALIKELLAEGKTEQEIKDYFVRQYGDRVLATPPPRGLNWLVYVIPPIAIVGGAYILYRAFRAWKQPPVEESEQVFTEELERDEYIMRLEEELRRR